MDPWKPVEVLRCMQGLSGSLHRTDSYQRQQQQENHHEESGASIGSSSRYIHVKHRADSTVKIFRETTV
uniref:Uncharacterized protein n=1 Tax=Trichogramma kaykai TaxID=54128 RepID=A0ABD2X248_9HYME